MFFREKSAILRALTFNRRRARRCWGAGHFLPPPPQQGSVSMRIQRSKTLLNDKKLVILEDDVEIGANTTIDRGSSRDTVIGAGSRLDNLVQIGHNVTLGRCCVIVAQVGISGSTVLEDFVRVGGQAAMAGHLRIGQGAEIGAQAGVISDMAPGAKVLGSPAQPKKPSSDKLPRSRRWQREKDKTAYTVRAVRSRGVAVIGLLTIRAAANPCH